MQAQISAAGKRLLMPRLNSSAVCIIASKKRRAVISLARSGVELTAQTFLIHCGQLYAANSGLARTSRCSCARMSNIVGQRSVVDYGEGGIL